MAEAVVRKLSLSLPWSRLNPRETTQTVASQKRVDPMRRPQFLPHRAPTVPRGELCRQMKMRPTWFLSAQAAQSACPIWSICFQWGSRRKKEKKTSAMPKLHQTFGFRSMALFRPTIFVARLRRTVERMNQSEDFKPLVTNQTQRAREVIALEGIIFVHSS